MFFNTYKVSLISYSPLAGGHLTHTGWESASKRSNTDKVIREKYDVSMTRIALAWQFAKGVAAPIVGATKAVHFEDAVHAVDLSLTDEDVNYLEEVYVPHNIVGALEAE